MDELASDLGLRYKIEEHHGSTFSFTSVPLFMLARVAPTLFSSTANLTMDGTYAVTFDFDETTSRQLLTILPRSIRSDMERALSAPFTEPQMIEIPPGEISLDIVAHLGETQHNDDETYVPFVVDGVSVARGLTFSIDIAAAPKALKLMSASDLSAHIDAAPTLSLAMVENNIPLVSRLSLTNNGTTTLNELVVELVLQPNFSTAWSCQVSSIPVGGTFNVDDIDLPLDCDKLVNQLERGAATLLLRVREGGVAEPILTASKAIDVLAYNEWNRATVQHVLAAFVMPNHPAIASLLAEARAPLERITSNPALNGYQSKDPKRAAAIAQAIYETIQSRGVTYSNPPASFEQTGQKIRTPDQVLTEQLGTCVDLSTLMAAALEQSGLNPIIILVRGHAFPGVWLEERYAPEGVIDDVARIRKLISLHRILVFDSSAVASRPAVTFAEAVRIANAALEDDKSFEYALDVQGARKLHFRPLTMRVSKQYAVVQTTTQNASGPVGIPSVIITETSSRARAVAPQPRNPRVDVWKQKLLDTTLRNRLINYKDSQKTLHLLCADLGAVEDAFAVGKEFVVRAKATLLGAADPRSKRLLDAQVADDGVNTFLRERLAHHELYSDLSTEKTDAKLLRIYRGAREALEETGSNPLCVTFGMLDWYESASSEQKRQAPILLLPVTIVRGTRANSFTLRPTGDDARLNVTLFEKLRIDHGITLPELSELPLDQAGGVDIAKVLNTVREVIINQPKWDVKDELHLGLFSFAKFQMWADLEHNLETILASPVVKHLVSDKKGNSYPNSGAFLEPKDLDSQIAPRNLLCPLDADASQLAAVAAAADGKTFVLQGPPGTGKSQTITNLIAHCLSQGKRVLFVAEKAAALDVVQRRLTAVGLAPYVLELHSHKSGKQQVLEQFKNALDSTSTDEPADWDYTTRKLQDEQEHLNLYVTALHKPRGGGLSVFRTLARLNKVQAAPKFELPAKCADSKEGLAQLLAEAGNLRDAAIPVMPVSTNPWRGCSLPNWQVDLPSKVSDAIDQTLSRIDTFNDSARRLATAIGANAPTTLGDIASLCEVASLLESAPPHGTLIESPANWATMQRQGQEIVDLVTQRTRAITSLRERYDDALFTLDVPALAKRFRKFASSFWLIAWWKLRDARRALRAIAHSGHLSDGTQVVNDLELAESTRALDVRLADANAQGLAIYGDNWKAERSDASALESVLSWATTFQRAISSSRTGLLPESLHRTEELTALAVAARAQLVEFRSSIQQLSDLLGRNLQAEFEQAPAPWQELRGQLTRWQGDIRSLRNWRSFVLAAKTLSEAGCAAVVSALERGEIAPEQIVSSLERGIFKSWISRELDSEPILKTFDGSQHARHVASFAELDRAHLGSCRVVARARVSKRTPTSGTTSGGEVGTLQRELAKKRRQMSIRNLLQEIPALASRLKPCFLMSPMSVAQYLDPKTTPKFDVIVFDEASQITTHDAIGALARGTNAVVVGDSKQLPPTSFFQGGDDEDSDDETGGEELESILDECLAAGLPERRLDWHYRSRHENLIAFSNFHYYGNRLNTFPSAAEHAIGRGVSFREVKGFYDKGKSRTNKAEGAAVVADLLARLKAPGADLRSYGIVTFSQAQQKYVEDLLDAARQKHPEIESFFVFDADKRPEPIIVKSLENIQGDERDVMIFSICYGPNELGVTSMNFGPINSDGGERRLNVAITRAREELVVFSTLFPEHIDLSRTKSIGVKHLKTFLDYARRGPRAISEALATGSSDEFDSPFEEEVCSRLRARGLDVRTQIGCAGYRIDLGICHPDLPGKYVLGVECDGKAYHSARSARERDRLRENVLGGLGWTIHRIWSTDWWQDSDNELDKVVAAFNQAKKKSEEPTRDATAVDERSVKNLDAPQSEANAVDTGRHSQAIPGMIAGSNRVAEADVALERKATASDILPYKIAVIPANRRTPEDFYDENFRNELKALVLQIVNVEAPVSIRVMARRVIPYFGILRTSSRLEERILKIIARDANVNGDIVWRSDQRTNTYSTARLAPPEARRESGEVPSEEIANAAATLLRANIALEIDELVKLTARALGFARVGENVAEHMRAGVAVLVARGTAHRDGDKVVLT